MIFLEVDSIGNPKMKDYSRTFLVELSEYCNILQYVLK